MLRLYNETGDELYLNLRYLALANVFNNMWLWECDYGYAEHYPTFFALFPLQNAPYTAVYEELECHAALHDYLAHYNGELPAWMKILIPEFIRNISYKASFYYPPNLPAEIVSEKTESGEKNPKLWIPLEDIYDGWEKPGQVGQEVYGSGLPFGFITRHYWQVPDEKFMVFVDYPTQDFSSIGDGKAFIHVKGDSRLSCRIRVIPPGRTSLPKFKVIAERDGNQEILKGKETPEGYMEYELYGDYDITLEWKKP